MNRNRALVFLVLGLAAAGCKDDNSSPAADVLEDVLDTDTSDVSDVSDDATPDATPDVVPDGSGDVAPAVEICDDGLDNDDDNEVDCDDADCDDDAACVWPHEFPAPECSDDDDCDDDAVCIGGGCAPSIDREDPPLDNIGVVTGVYLPEPDDDACCFDLDGDGETDNAISEIVRLWNALPDGESSDERITAILEHGIYDALITLNADENRIALIAANNDLDLNGHPDVAYPERHDTASSYQVWEDHIGANGPEFSLFGEASDGLFQSTWASFTTSLPSIERCSFRFHAEENWVDVNAGIRCRSELPLALSFYNLRAEFEYVATDGTLTSTDTDTDAGTLGGLKLGGYIGMDMIAGALSNTYYDQCACVPGMDVDSDFFVTTEAEGALGVACATTPSSEDIAANCSESQQACAGLPQVCAALDLPVVSDLADYDSDGDDVLDAMSFGIRLTVAPALLADNTYIPPQEVCVGGEDEDGDGLIDCDDPFCWDDRNCGGVGHSEDCNDGLDNTNNNGLVDCEDGTCRDNLACVEDDGSGDGDGSGD